MRALVVLALAVTAARAGAQQAEGAIALTLSGVAANPRARRSIGVAEAPVGIRFRAPTTAGLTTVHLDWRRSGANCGLSLHPDTGSGPGEAIARAPLDPQRGWNSVPLVASLLEGTEYHLLVQCPADSEARLAYTVDRVASDAAGGTWQLEVELSDGVRARPAPATPLFALTFADGTSWGNPYDARRGSMRVCGAEEIRVALIPAQTLAVDGLAPSVEPETAIEALRYSLETADGTVLASGVGPGAGNDVTLDAGRTFWLHLSAPDLHAECIAVPGLRMDLRLGPPVVGIDTTAVIQTSDGGKSWVHQPVDGVSAALHFNHGHKQTTTTMTIAPTTTLPPTTSTTATTTSSTTTRPTTTTTSTTRPTTSSTTTTTTRPTTSSTTTTTTTIRPSTTSTTTTTTIRPTTTSTSTTSTTLPSGQVYRAPYADGYIGLYDSNTIPLWPQRMILMLGEANAQGPLINNAKQVAATAGNGDARFIFYFSLTEMDSRCNCFDQYFYDSFVGTHPEWILHDANGNPVTTANGIGRLYASDIGNTGYVDAWADRAFGAMDKYGWDGVFADSIIRGNFAGWSGAPINPRTGQPYTSSQYRQDMLAALQRLRTRFDARGALFVGNHSSAWDPATFADPVVKAQVTVMHGVELEDCVYNFSGVRHTESNWIAQLQYLDYANRNGVRSICNGPDGVMNDTTARWYVLATYLLTKEGFSSVAEINNVSTWWDGLDYRLGAPLGRFYCLDPSAGLARTTSCPSTGNIYGRDWQNGRVLVNPTSSTSVHVPLGETLLLRGTPVTAVDLAPGSGVVLMRP